ncbi:MAG: MOFRL family protein [Thermoleophilia bacterium]
MVTPGDETVLDPERQLEQNDAYTFFRELGDRIVTGPTGTNVNDLYGVIAG